MPIDPVCGIEMDESLALIHEHDGEKYYFCCIGYLIQYQQILYF